MTSGKLIDPEEFFAPQGWRNFYSYLRETVGDIEGSPINFGRGHGQSIWVHSASDIREWLFSSYQDFSKENFAEQWGSRDEEE